MQTINVTNLAYSLAVGRLEKENQDLSNAALAKIKPNLSVIDEIMSNDLKSEVSFGGVIIRNIGIGSNITNTALASLKESRERIHKIIEDITGLTSASPDILRIAQANHQQEVDQINATLRNLAFNGRKLFDGSLATTGLNASVASEGMPENYSPYVIQTGLDASINNIISFPKLVAGDGSAVDSAVPSRFQPLFPTLSPSYKRVTDRVTSIKNALNKPGVDSLTKIDTALNALADTPIIGLAIKINLEIEAEGSTTNDTNTADNAAITNFGITIERVTNIAQTVLNAALKSLNVKSSAITEAQITQVVGDIRNALKVVGGDLEAVRKAARDLDINALIPANANSVLISVYQSIGAVAKATARAIFDIDGAADSTDAGIQANNAIQSKDAIFNSIDAVTATIKDITTTAGNVETADGRTAVVSKLNAAISTLDTVIASATGQNNSLLSAQKSMETQVKEASAAASKISKYNPAEVVPVVIENLKTIQELSSILRLQQAQDQAVNRTMEQLAAAAAA